MISLRDKGASLPEIHGTYLGNTAKQIMRGFTIILMILVGVVFINTPATLLNAHFTQGWSPYIWILLILAYYLVATLLPIDKVIGKIYPIFGILLLGMAVAIFVAFLLYKPEIPELWSGLQNRHPDAANNPIFPMMFISIACGAISGFHATQSPLMARCMINEKQGRPIFYGAMITEGIVALIWAAAAAYFFGPDSVVDITGKSGAGIVGVIANTWFTPAIATITILGVISAAITSGDTAMRSARLILSDLLHYDQKPIKNRLIIAIPLFAVSAAILVYSIADAKGFQVIWRYFAWANQVLATVTLWAITVYLWKNKGKHWYFFTFFPALFMTMVTGCFLFVAKAADGGLGSIVPRPVGYGIGVAITLISLITFLVWKRKHKPA
jgi:carbon starvation protein CstA